MNKTTYRIILQGMAISAGVLLAAAAGGDTAEAGPKEAEPLTITVKASPEAEFATELEVRSPNLTKGLRGVRKHQDTPVPPSDTYVTWKEGGVPREFSIDGNGVWHEGATGEGWELPEGARSELSRYIEAARQAHYGRLVPWDEASKTVTMKSICTVTDLETGRSFQAQRRAGRSHADMQPVSKADTKIMKEIYGGAWSWRRRAVLVQLDGRGPALAASMHGMPHGGDGIPDNGFSGHFCIHFLGSATHGSKHVDPDHQWMVYKASGRLDEALGQADPAGVAEGFIVALNQKDGELLKRTFASPGHSQLSYFLSEMESLQGIKPVEGQREGASNPPGDDVLSAEVAVDTTVYRKDHKPERRRLIFRLKREGMKSPWKIEQVMLSA
ncbi:MULTISPECIES: hypothetical protein [Paenibacillus]|uniref:hypothetical protein n=1 Tax=Paenibacillus TaxID=44249 RepID=UPI0022B8E93F|nr:hypothetical protein [Paenibacillus caseinilyticus]MCZ8522566.1 hypothetical protein [Paenibacillus caseinilyticus]